MSLLSKIRNVTLKYLGGNDYKKLLQVDIVNNYIWCHMQNEKLRTPEQKAQDRQTYIKLQTHYMTLYGRYHTWEGVDERKVWQ